MSSAAFVRYPRRAVLGSGLGLGGALVLGCSSQPLGQKRGGASASEGGAGGAGGMGSDPFAGGELLTDVPFAGEGDPPLEEPFNQGLDGRLYTDLSKLDDAHLLTPSAAFYIRTRYPDLLVPETLWKIRVLRAGQADVELVQSELEALATDQGAHLMECSGNARGAAFGLLSSADWTGVPLLTALADVPAPADATAILVSGFDQHSRASANSTAGASWVFSLAELEQVGAFLATQMNGAPLLPDHGAPVRLLVPGWYGCTCIKWVNEISFVGPDAPATSQMLEFASRTMQNGAPTLARDYLPAEIDLAAMPTRIEKWQIDGKLVYRVVGIEWGGSAKAPALEIRFGDGAWQAVDKRSSATDVATWRLWEHAFRPPQVGSYSITLRVPDASVRTRRLDSGYYLREVTIDEV
ncbi:MAG TPA: molybdopterin-dependent oxidoreductase [Polyangiaceae bacterium]|nr:molybdopterin-dependent oxidoreductase [Polyangiaceae bacterium]